MPSARRHLHCISLGLSPRGFIFSRVCRNFRYSFNHKSQRKTGYGRGLLPLGLQFLLVVGANPNWGEVFFHCEVST
ncbi:hypothetical protein ACHQM5_021101 [Ranunculus cassubicifolius]